MKTVKTPAALLFILIFSLASGCNRLLAPSGPSNLSSASLTVPQADNALSCNLYNFYNTQSGNIFFSPFSIITALAMTQEGAMGQTASQMQQVLGLSSDAATRQQAFQTLIGEINAPGKSYTLDTSDDLWPQVNFPVLASFENVLETDYFAGVTAVDYINNASGALQTINGAVSQQTEGYIPSLLSNNDITPATRLILTNAVYFKADWANEFDPHYTTTQNFTLPSSATVPVSMMNQPSLLANIGSYNGAASVVALPYKNNEASMYIFLPPPGGMAALESEMSPSNLNTWLAANSAAMTVASFSSVNLSLPRFTFNSSYDLAQTLAQMGMPLAFSKAADFSGIDGQKDLYIYKVVHKAYIDVTESGTTAAAATGVGIKVWVTISGPPPVDFTVDHPFIFMIVENVTNTVLFVGRINDPTQTQ
jgi:serpin B